jgi:hypothetical protein
MSHHCHANGCATETPPRLFMCPRHWDMVPHHMKRDVLSAYRKNVTRMGRATSRAYLSACAQAAEFVARLEGRDGGNSYRRVMEALDAKGQLNA